MPWLRIDDVGQAFCLSVCLKAGKMPCATYSPPLGARHRFVATPGSSLLQIVPVGIAEAVDADNDLFAVGTLELDLVFVSLDEFGPRGKAA